MTTLTSNAVDTLNALLRASVAAQETYKTAIETVEKKADHGAIALRVLLDNHTKHVALLSEEVQRLGGDPDLSGGVWGKWASARESLASLFGDASALALLKDAEKHGIHVAESGLAELDEPARLIVKNRILTDLHEHLELLAALSKPL